jgi:acyl-CoA synthetase (AMP-forming)/AMP-acid ligase II
LTAPAPTESANIAQHLPRMAAAQPEVAALKIPRGRREGRIDYLTLSFAELEAEAAAWQHHLHEAGVERGDRVLVMVRQGLPLIASVFALFATGAVPVVIDPGMGRKSFLRCIERTQPRALLGIPLARMLSRVFRRAFRSVRVRVPASGSTTARCHRSSDMPDKLEVVSSAPDELAAILFTSGSTGAPKGVCYEHGMFAAQVEMIRRCYGITPGEVDLPMLPIFALFNPALGMTTIVPEIDPSKPAAVDPVKIVQAITQENITNSFGSPTLWLKIAHHCKTESLALPTLRRVLSAGAPVPPALWELSRAFLPNGTLHSPYGATDVLPVSSISAKTGLDQTAPRTLSGRGTCVGPVLAENDVRIIALTDEPIAHLSDAPNLPAGEIGEIIVHGPTVTKTYDALPEATARAKITGDDGSIWHRIGDCGYLDPDQRLWFCGRMAERVITKHGTLFTEQVEPFFNARPEVSRCALIGVGPADRQRAALAVEPSDPLVLKTSRRGRELGRTLRAAAAEHPYASRISLFYFHPGFPVDVRHNAKIHRLTLTHWAETEGVGLEIDHKK